MLVNDTVEKNMFSQMTCGCEKRSQVALGGAAPHRSLQGAPPRLHWVLLKGNRQLRIDLERRSQAMRVYKGGETSAGPRWWTGLAFDEGRL